MKIIITVIMLIIASTFIMTQEEIVFEQDDIVTFLDDDFIVINNSFHYVESNPQSIPDIFMAPIKGFVEAALIIGFVLFVGGIFGVLQKTQAVDSVIKSIAKAHKKSKIVKIMLIPLFMILFSLGGAAFGMSEEIIPFILIFVPS